MHGGLLDRRFPDNGGQDGGKSDRKVRLADEMERADQALDAAERRLRLLPRWGIRDGRERDSLRVEEQARLRVIAWFKKQGAVGAQRRRVDDAAQDRELEPRMPLLQGFGDFHRGVHLDPALFLGIKSLEPRRSGHVLDEGVVAALPDSLPHDLAAVLRLDAGLPDADDLSRPLVESAIRGDQGTFRFIDDLFDVPGLYFALAGLSDHPCSLARVNSVPRVTFSPS